MVSRAAQRKRLETRVGTPEQSGLITIAPMHASIKDKAVAILATAKMSEAVTKPGQTVQRIFHGDEQTKLQGQVNNAPHGAVLLIGV